ncbi:unnamed protein product, partial [Ectocarpus sp. 8 AP-2014]
QGANDGNNARRGDRGVSSPGTTLPAAPTASRRATCWGRAGRSRTDSTRGHSWRVGSVGRSHRSRRSQAPDPALLSRRQCLRVGPEKDRGKDNWREPFGEQLPESIRNMTGNIL